MERKENVCAQNHGLESTQLNLGKVNLSIKSLKKIKGNKNKSAKEVIPFALYHVKSESRAEYKKNVTVPCWGEH